MRRRAKGDALEDGDDDVDLEDVDFVRPPRSRFHSDEESLDEDPPQVLSRQAVRTFSRLVAAFLAAGTVLPSCTHPTPNCDRGGHVVRSTVHLIYAIGGFSGSGCDTHSHTLTCARFVFHR